MNKKIKKAFSLLEISVIILIIGLLIAAISQGSYLLSKAKLSTAQKLTENSPLVVSPPVAEGLEVWLETTLDRSFSETELEDGTVITTWNDIKPSYLGDPINATKSGADGVKPVYETNVFHNGIAGLKFDGSNDSLSIDTKFLAQSDYTIFIVDKRISQQINTAYSYNALFGGAGSAQHGTVSILYRNAGDIFYDHFNHGYAINPTTPFVFLETYIHTAYFSKSDGKKYFINSGKKGSGSNSSQKTALLSTHTTSYLAQHSTGHYYNGYIAEVIIFSRALDDLERLEIEEYLAQKYNVKIN